MGQGTYISPDVIVGKKQNAKIGYNCTLDGDIIIGDNTNIYNNVNMINRIKIGENCIIHSGVNMGNDDHSCTEDEDHNKVMIKHYGGIDIRNNIFIGAGYVINRGTISHNMILGEKSALVSGTRIYGSVKTGANAYIAFSIIKNQVELGENVVVEMGSIVLNTIEDDATVEEVPAKNLNKREITDLT